MVAVRTYVLESTEDEPGPSLFNRHEPEKTLLYRTIQKHFLTFLADCDASDHQVHFFVRKEFEAFLRCGILAHGFARVYCQECRFDRLVAFSCKKRGFCPSCMARRMSETAAHLVDSVIPFIPTGQWVLSVPTPLRYLMAYDPEACNLVLHAFTSSVSSFLALKAKRLLSLTSSTGAHSGAVMFIQRFGSAMNLNVHFHTLFSDGVFVEEDGQAQFHPLPEPSPMEIMEVTERIAQKVQRWLKKRLEEEFQDEFSEKESLLSACYRSSIRYCSAMGERTGKPLMRMISEPNDTYEPREGRSVSGFNLHASRAIQSEDRLGLEQLLRYMGRPPISEDRLSLTSEGRLVLRFKKPWVDGTSAIILTPTEFLERLTALIPPPRKNQIRYHGVFAPNAKLRAQIVPKPSQNGGEEADSGESQKSSGSGRRWAQLLARVFGMDVLECPRCLSRMQRISFVTERKSIVAILKSLQMTTAPPEVTRAGCSARQDEFDFA